MQTQHGIFNTDQVNLQNIRVPLEGLVGSLERHIGMAVAAELPIGTPSHYAHDLHRPLGWSVSTSVHLAADMARQLGTMLIPDTPEERVSLEDARERYFKAHEEDALAPYRDDLLARLELADPASVTFIQTQAACAKRAGLAAELYPGLFALAATDKDGLVDLAAIDACLREVQPGVFEDEVRGLLVFAHPYFRRSLSHRNHLNAYFLETFRDVTANQPAVRARIRLDPDLIGLAASARWPIELEHWRGPSFSDDIAAIPVGVAEHKASERARMIEGIDKTQIWWKGPEPRKSPQGAVIDVRTFEVEELIEHASGGLAEDHYGCRYAHAEYSCPDGVISHFDGAIRAYGADAYFARLDRAIDRAEKHAAYTKIFRFDGPLPVADWKRLLCDYYRGNLLVPEYLSGPQAAAGAEPHASSQAYSPVASREPDLAVLLQLDRAIDIERPAILVEDVQLIGETRVPFIEIGSGAVADVIRNVSALDRVCTVEFGDGVLNLPTILLGGAVSPEAFWRNFGSRLANAIDADASAHGLRMVSTTIAWNVGGLTASLSCAGTSDRVAALLRETVAVIRFDQPPSAWIEALDGQVKRLAPRLDAPVECNVAAYERGRLLFERDGEMTVSMMFPQHLESVAHAFAAANEKGEGHLQRKADPHARQT